jgi:peroxygenase
VIQLHEGVLIKSVDAGSPYGANMTDLMRHVQFFDEDRDGLLTIPESTKGAYIYA